MRHLLDLNDLEMDIPRKIVDMAKVYKSQNKGLAQGAPLLGRTLGMIFEKPSTRTRVSFEVAMTELGGSAIFLDANSMQLGRGETIEDTARVLGRYIDGIMLRAIKHETLIQMSKYSEIPVINGLTDMSHPCQALADIMTYEENLGSIKGKKIAWIGDGNNVANSWLHASAIFGCELYLACPETRLPSKKAIEWAKNNGGNIEITQDPLSAAKNANAIITDTWISMGENFSKDPESIFSKYRVDHKIMSIASKEVIFMHCLPAHRGQEVTADIIDGPNSVVWDEAENRLHIQKAVLTWAIANNVFT